MMAGSKISCMGIVGDGCGGGREFIVENGELYAYDEVSNTRIVLLKNIDKPISITKAGCIVTIVCINGEIYNDVSPYREKCKDTKELSKKINGLKLGKQNIFYLCCLHQNNLALKFLRIKQA